MDVDRTLLSIAMTYLNHGYMDNATLEGLKYLLKDSTDRRAIQIFNNGAWYDTKKDYFTEREEIVMKKNVIRFYVGRKPVKIDLSDLLSTDTQMLESISYKSAKKHGMFIAAIETAIEDYYFTDGEVHICDEDSYKSAIAELVNIINNEKEEVAMSEEATNVTVNNVTVIKEEKVMGRMEDAVQDLMASESVQHILEVVDDGVDTVSGMVADGIEALEDLKDDVVVVAGETMDDLVAKTDKAFEKGTNIIGVVIKYIDQGLGLSVLADNIVDIWQTPGSFRKKSAKTLMLLNREASNLEYWGDQDSLKKAAQLRALSGDARGKSIFEAFASVCIWITKKVTRKLRKWFDLKDEKSVINTIIGGVSSFFKLLGKGVKFTWSITKKALSYAITGIVIVGGYIFNAVRKVFSAMKDWCIKQYQRFTQKDVEEDVLEDEEEFDFDEFEEI